jgi:hypothetical protein
MTFRPKFNDFYKVEWPYAQQDGVGLKLTGYPNNIDTFLDILHGESCNPVAARRILDELHEKGEKNTTLRSHLDFNRIGNEFKSLGVKMEIISPLPYDKVHNQSIDLAVLNLVLHNEPNIEHFCLTHEEKEKVFSSLVEFKKSLKEHEHDLGCYGTIISEENHAQNIPLLKKTKI